MEKRTTYHEQTDMENTLKLREVLKTLPGMAGDFSVPSVQQPRQAPESSMPMTSAFSFSFY